MYLQSAFLVLILSMTTASACEGACITGITNAFIGNYSFPVQKVFLKLANRIITTYNIQGNPQEYIQPINDTFFFDAKEFYRQAIFPSFFHGKCQDPRTGINPPGCPNPDCPVVCGTPGSMVHFYPHLRFIAYNTTIQLFLRSSDPNSSAFSEMSSRVAHAIQSRKYSRPSAPFRLPLAPAFGSGTNTLGMTDLPMMRRAVSMNKTLTRILQEFQPLLDQECGGYNKENPTLSRCSWETTMKAYILTFP